MQPEELAAVFAHLPHLAQNLAVLTVEKPDVVVGQIGDVQQPLLLVWREHHAACGTANSCPFRHLEFLDKFAVSREDVNPVGHAIGGVDQPVV